MFQCSIYEPNCGAFSLIFCFPPPHNFLLSCLVIHIAIDQNLHTVIKIADMNGGEGMQSVRPKKDLTEIGHMPVNHLETRTMMETKSSKTRKKIEKTIEREDIILFI